MVGARLPKKKKKAKKRKLLKREFFRFPNEVTVYLYVFYVVVHMQRRGEKFYIC